ncbi:MAG: selenocysteine-specific translation elongation factor [Phycisphaerales bacterium]|nr:selenocysteine-specific translation elongation factor [Phycisphaerales bacterium]
MTATQRDNAGTLPDGERFLILGTAGHIDHGKTSLVKALTGTDTDRLPEEQRRGMTIELGFAELVVGSFHFGVVDVPGHERFVRTMAAGATGIDLALLVVAADDSIMPQTVEHVEILRLLGLEHAVVALTKCDLVDGEMIEWVTAEIRELLASTPFAAAAVVPVSSTTGHGLDDLRNALRHAAGRITPKSRRNPFRMGVDRVFTIQGRGTVVTGSVVHGTVATGDALEFMPGRLPCRVRDLQSHGTTNAAIECGRRAALNLIGVDRDCIDRGLELTTPGFLNESTRIDAAFQALASWRREIKPYAVVRVCMGTREIHARLIPIDRAPVAPGDATFVQLCAAERFVATHGQRFIVRTDNGTRTIGGGIVLRPVARRWTRDRDAERVALHALQTGDAMERTTQVLVEAGFDRLTDLEIAARTGADPVDVPSILRSLDETGRRIVVRGTDRPVPPAVVDRVFERATRWLDRHHRQHPDEPGPLLDALVGWFDRQSSPGWGKPLTDRFVSKRHGQLLGRFVCLPSFAPELSAMERRQFEATITAFCDSAFQPPGLDELAAKLETDVKRLRRLVQLAVAHGELVEIDGTIFLHSEHERRMRDVVADMIRVDGGVTVAQVRERLASSRKYAVPLLEYLDRARFTRRVGDRRVLFGNPSA